MSFLGDLMSDQVQVLPSRKKGKNKIRENRLPFRMKGCDKPITHQPDDEAPPRQNGVNKKRGRRNGSR